MDNEERGVSIAEIFKVIFKRVWWVIGVTAACLLIFVLIVQLWYNRQNQTYSVSYTIDFPGIDEGNYPDGTPFRYSAAVSLAVLNDIVDGNEQLSGIDVEDMVNSDSISISQNVESYESSSGTVVERSYTLTVGVKYFNSTDQAAAFLRAVSSYPVNRAREIVGNTAANGYLSIFDSASTFEAKIQALADQRDYLLGMYDEMISAMSGEYTTGGRTLTDYRAQVAETFSENDETYLNSVLTSGNYVLDYEQYSQTADAQIKALQQQIDDNQKRIDSLTALRNSLTDNGATLDAYDTLIAQLTDENTQLVQQQDKIEAVVEWINGESRDTDIADFTAQLNSYRDALNNVTSTFRTVSESYYDAMCDISYASNVITAQGGLNIVLAALIGAVLGFIVVSIVICIIDMPKYIRQRDAAIAAAQAEENKEDEENQ